MAERRARGEQRRETILAGALRVIGEHGTGAVTHRAVATAADTRPGLVTYYFPTIDELLEAALERFVTLEVTRLREAQAELEALAEADPEAVTQRLAAVLNDDQAWAAAQFELYLAASRRPALREAASRSLEAYRDVLAAALRAVGAPDPEDHAELFLALGDGLGLHRLAEGGETGGRAQLIDASLTLFRGLTRA